MSSLALIAAAVRGLREPLRIQHAWARRRFRSAGLTEHQIELPSASVHCWLGEDDGRPPLVLLMGFGASVEWQFHPNVRALARHRRLIVPDLVYFGGSRARGTERTLELQVQVIAELLDELNIERADLAGLSYGGFVAFGLALRHPERVGCTVFVASPGPAMQPADYVAMCRRFDVPDMAEVLMPDEPAGVPRLLEIAWHRPPWIPAWILPQVHAHLFADRVDHKRALLANLVGLFDDRPDYCPPPGPVLLVWGEHDQVFPVELAHRLRRMLGAKAQLTVLRKAAHAPQLEHPRRFNRALNDFFSQHAPTPDR